MGASLGHPGQDIVAPGAPGNTVDSEPDIWTGKVLTPPI